MQESNRRGFGSNGRFITKQTNARKKTLTGRRGLRFEPLEDRRMLSVLFVDDDAASGGNGAAWSTAFDDLQPALETAEMLNSDAVAENDVTEIWIAEGTYAPSANLEQDDERSVSFSLVDGVTLYGGFTGNETTLSARDLAANQTILSGDIGVQDDFTDNAYTVVYCGEGVAAGVDGVTITRGNASGESSSERRERQYGGGVFSAGELTIVNSAVLGNRAGDGGGVFNEGILAVTNSVVSGNFASHGTGGIRSGYTAELLASNATIAGNETYNGRCGGLDASGDATVVNSLICLNEGEEAVFSDWDPANIANNLIGIDPGFARNPSSGSDGAWGTSDDDYGDLRLTSRSPAIDLGDTARLPGDVTDSNGDGDAAEAIPLDLEGNARVFGDAVDIGAYEYQGTALPGRETPSLVVTTADDEFDLYDADITLREAAFYAGIVDMGATITFNSSLDGGTILLDGNPIELRGSLTLDASLLNAITIDAAGRSRVFHAWGNAGTEVELIGLTVTGGASPGHGGGILNEATTLRITDCAIQENETKRSGGGVYSKGTLFLQDSSITANWAEYSGGGIEIGLHSSALITNSAISENSADNGGGLLCAHIASLEIVDSTIAENESFRGAGIYSQGELTITDTSILNNDATGAGGGIWNGTYGTLTVQGSNFAENEVGYLGGGIANESDRTVSVSDSTFLRNSTHGNGGAIHTSAGTLDVVSCVFSGNLADVGGAIAATDAHAPTHSYEVVNIANSLFTGNTADDGAAIYHMLDSLSITNCTITGNTVPRYQRGTGGCKIAGGSKATINNSIIAENQAAPDRQDILFESADVSGSHNLIGNGDGQTIFVNGSGGNIVGTPGSPIDPLFVRAPSDGGDGWGDNPDTPDVDESANDDYGDLRIAAGSPAIDHGGRAGLVADVTDLDGDGDVDEPIPVDLAGEERIQSVAVDIGAYEYVVDPDLDGDGLVASAELDIVRGNWGAQVTPGDRSKGDFSGDGVTDSTDLSIVRMHYGEVPAASKAVDAVFAATDEDNGDSDFADIYGPLAENHVLNQQRFTKRNPHGALAALSDAAWHREIFGKADSSPAASKDLKKAALLAFLES